MDPHLRFFAARQEDVVAAWQLRRAGWTSGKLRHHLYRGGWRSPHRGVYVLTNGAVTQRQRWIAAVLTTPRTVLSHESAAACYGFHRFDRGYEVVTRPGRAGRGRYDGLLVFRRWLPAEELTKHAGIPITTAARVLVDLAPGLNDKRLGRAFRESIRLGHATAAQIDETVGRHLHRPGASRLARLVARYATIPYERTRSDAEALALELLFDAGIPLPLVNYRIGGEEADLVWPDARVIIEIEVRSSTGSATRTPERRRSGAITASTSGESRATWFTTRPASWSRSRLRATVVSRTAAA